MTLINALTKLGSAPSQGLQENSLLVSSTTLEGNTFGNNEVSLWPFHRKKPVVVVINNKGEKSN
ncbi:hypothetical protein DDB_G0268894 [Dictyostelium discoideum AX4]|uniref:Uncharacterized protein n=1 Tax=Dictyostelium discoideum TaxID=44689 RepID=Q55EH7_DICDI|nr:hypothetical protein DDB_G0268894 [Dictyostelium discoideum AX4]EAL73036.1 hypothetical protein DDB_G0268894 [Dictyostelium discoideum AX4]|eukprot:XP_647043.1 hypothetical protein DDB_G0268894 [Dictyostelium discoideum AX4]